MAARDPDVRKFSAQVAKRTHRRGAGHPTTLEARRDLNAARAAQYIRRVVAGAPPLTPEQIEYLRSLLPAPRASTMDSDAA